MRKSVLFALSIILLLLCHVTFSAEPVKVWEEPLTLPTYVVNAPEKSPMFFKNQSYQGASRVIYPYAQQDNITNEKIDKTYKALYLENEYIKLCVMPEIGGRLFYAIDKTDGYDLFYHQHVIKPANIGMLGAWISGGVEFCVFHHHRASTNLPVDYKLEQNNDGSATIWIGETEPRHRMKWTIGITLYPGKSYIELNGRLINPTDNINSMLYWANVATHVNDDYQVIFPPSTDFAVYHAKNSFAHWPVTSEVYNHYDYYQNHIDASWWKNHPNPISMFAFEIKDGFLAGYDHGKHAGTMHVANHNIVKGAKLWEWGPGAYGAMWDSKVLTDHDGPYAELMTGAYSDNQPDYSWLKPYEYKVFQQHWYPLRETEGAVEGNLNGALNLVKKDKEKFFIAANATQLFSHASILLKKDGNVVYSKQTDISPAKPFTADVKLAGVDESELTLQLVSENGEVLVSYQPVAKETDLPLPEPVTPPGDPKKIESLEELYLTGLRIYQFHNARISPEPYFREALDRDSLDVRSNTMMGILAEQDFNPGEAARYYRTALRRLTANYTRPRDCEPFFHLGVVLEQQGLYAAAYDTLYRAAWDQNFASAAYFHLAQISSIRGNFDMALTEIERSLSYNSSNLSAMNLRAALLRVLDKDDLARQQIAQVLAKDPLNFQAIHESVLLGDTPAEELNTLMRNDPESWLELAVAYLNSGFADQALTLLENAANSGDEHLANYPTLHYYLGYLYQSKGDSEKAGAHFKLASELPIDYCFPYRFETIVILRAAMQNNPDDAKACYYLGDLLYDKQPEGAIAWWEKAVAIDPTMAMAYRNLGWGYDQTLNDQDKAMRAYETAIQNDPSEPVYFYELDKLYEKNGTDISKRYRLLTENHGTVVQRPDALLQEAKVLMLAGKYETAINYLLQTFFPRTEGVDNIHDIYTDACLAQGVALLDAGDPAQALKYFNMADEYPENHQEARDPEYQKNAAIHYYQALALEKSDRKKANELWDKATSMSVKAPQYQYYQALAWLKKHNKSKAENLAKQIRDQGDKFLADSDKVDFFSKFGGEQSNKIRQANGHYLLGLASRIEGNTAAARDHFQQASRLNPSLLWAQVYVQQPDEE